MIKEPLIQSPNLPKTWHNHTNATSLQTYPMPTQTGFSEVEYASEKKLIWRDHHWHSGLTSLPQAGAGSRAAGVLSAAKDAAPPHNAHVGADAETGLVQTVVGTAASVNDVTQVHALLHGEETGAFGDLGYQSVDKREENQGEAVRWHIALRPGKRRALPQTPWGAVMDRLERVLASVGAEVEHVWHVAKNVFRHRKTRYRGLQKNTQQLHTLSGLANLVPARRWFSAHEGPSAP
jgi:hypothetical protein